MKLTRLLTTAAALLLAVNSFAQNDSLAFVSGAWKTTQVSDGIVLKECAFTGDLFNSNQYVCVLEVAPDRHIDIVASDEATLAGTTVLAEKYGAVAAVNGGFFNMRAPYGSISYIRVDNEEISPNKFGNPANGNVGRDSRLKGSVVCFKGQLYVVKADDIKAWEKYIEAEDVLTTGPMLLIGGEDEFVAENSFNKTRHPRTAAGRRLDGTAVLVTVDGRHAEAAGASMWELQSMMRWLGCCDAINLDGGGSTAMVVSGKIVNHPCDNKKFDPEGERRVANAILVK